MTRTPAAPSAYAFSTALPPPGITGPVTSAIFPLTFAPAKSFWPFARAAPPTTAISASAAPLPDRPPRGAPLRRQTRGSLPAVLFHPAELLQDDAGVELLEERLRLAKLLPGLELRRRPRPCETAVVAGEDLVRRRVLLANSAALGRRGDDPVVPEVLMELLAGERNERGEHQLEVVDATKRDVQDRPRALTVRRDQLPGLVRREVLVHERGEMQGLLERGTKACRLEVFSDAREAVVDRLHEDGVLSRERPGPGHLAEAAKGVHEGPVREVAPGRDELVVVPSQEVRPGEVGVLRLGTGEHEVEPQRVGVVPREEVIDVHRDPAARRELSALHGEELARHDVVRELQGLAAPARDLPAVAVAEQDRGPDGGVEDDVVLPHEVEVAARGVLPEVAPRLGAVDHLRPLDRRGEVADHRVEPHVHAFVRAIFPSRKRDGHAPVDVAGDRARLEVRDVVEREVAHVRPPVRLT